ncbi:MAG: hypothetical protein CMB11_01705 [Euryarchaeota archaeon]|nr:hypothetical protein [Euryarchaeota archaeon]
MRAAQQEEAKGGNEHAWHLHPGQADHQNGERRLHVFHGFVYVQSVGEERSVFKLFLCAAPTERGKRG